MSSRAAETLREDLESRGPMRLSEVEAQQKEILKTVRRLADEGQIVIGGGGDDTSSNRSRQYARFIPSEEIDDVARWQFTEVDERRWPPCWPRRPRPSR
jgi:hypothetical protein